MAIAYDATGAGSGTAGASAGSITWAHTCGTGANLLIVGIGVGFNSGGNSYTARTVRSATYNGIAMTSVGITDNDTSNYGYTQLFYLLNPPMGASYNVVCTVTAAPYSIVGNSVSYTGVGFVGAMATIRTNGGTPSVAVTSATGRMVVAVQTSGAAIATPTGTQRVLNNFNAGSGAGNLLIQDRAGATSATLGSASNGDQHGLVGLDLLPSAISFISAASAEATTLTMPTHQTGDMLIMHAFRNGTATPPTLPAGWTQITTGTTTSTAAILGYKVAASGSETSGTWTNATGLECQVYRGVLRIGANVVNSGVTADVAYSTLTLTNVDGTSWVAAFGGHRSVNGNMGAATTGLVNRNNLAGATNDMAGWDTNGGVAAWAGVTTTTGETSSGWVAFSVELQAAPQTGIVSFDAGTSGIVNFTTSGSVNLTVAANTYIVCHIAMLGTPTTVTFGGASMTLLGGPNTNHKVYGYVNTTSGTKACVVNTGSSTGFTFYVASYYNVVSADIYSGRAMPGLSDTYAVSWSLGQVTSLSWAGWNSSASSAYFSALTGGANRFNGQDGNRSGIAYSDAAAPVTFGATLNPSYASGGSVLSIILKPVAAIATVQFFTLF